MRQLLRGFAERGGTVLLSSHLLHEVEALADRLLIISNGRIVASGTVDELLAKGGTLVRAREETRLCDVLERAGFVARRAGGDGLVRRRPARAGRGGRGSGRGGASRASPRRPRRPRGAVHQVDAR